MLNRFSIKDKVVGSTTDNASNVFLSAQLLGFFHIPCLTHKLNLCVTDCLGAFVCLKEAREKISSLVTATKRSGNVKREEPSKTIISASSQSFALRFVMPSSLSFSSPRKPNLNSGM